MKCTRDLFVFLLITACEKLFQFKFQLQNWDTSRFLIEHKKALIPQITDQLEFTKTKHSFIIRHYYGSESDLTPVAAKHISDIDLTPKIYEELYKSNNNNPIKVGPQKH